MKTIFHSIAVGLLLSAGISTASAQIRNNESSVSALAIQCAVSSGYSAADYEEYCRSLAKTIGMLSSAQQTRVFGYLPMPGGGEASETEAAVESSPVNKNAPIQTSASTTTSPVTSTTVSNTDSPVDSPSTTAATTTTASGSGNTVGNTTSPTQNSSGSNGSGNSILDFLLQLLRGSTQKL